MLKIKNSIKKIAPKPVWNMLKKILSKPYMNYINKKYRETLMHYGEANANTTFYVIRRTPPAAGLFSNYLHILGHIIIAKERNLVPVVDMENYETFYNEKNFINNSRNPWEYYFMQPSKYSLPEVYKSKNVILSSGDFPFHTFGSDDFPQFHYSFIKLTKELNQVICTNILLNKSTEEYVEKQAENILLKDKKILGVATRGTDYKKLLPLNHPIQPSTDHLIELTKEKMSEWNVDFIFLTTEENETLQKFKEAFPGKILATQRERHTNYNSDLYTAEVRFARENDKYLTGLEYLTEMVILSRCNYFLGALCSGVMAAILMNGEKYEDKHIIDLGLYH